MRKIAIITPFLANGGLEKVAVVEAKELSQYFDVTLIVMDTFHIDYPYNGKMIDLHVSLMDRGLFKRLYNIVLSTLKLGRLKKQHGFDLVISHGELANLPNVLSGGKNNVLVVHENRFAAIKDMQGKLVNRMIKYIYSAQSVSKVVTVSEGIRDSFIEILGMDEQNIAIIHNPYAINEIKLAVRDDLDPFDLLFSHPVLMTVGRLTMAKGQWSLLRTFKELKKLNPNLKLVILGDGELKEQLLRLSTDLGLKTYSIWSKKQYDDKFDVYFLGFQQNPFKFIKQAKMFIMTSLWEGFGGTIVEAMACGTPVISTNCKSGPGEIICPTLEKETMLIEPNYDGFGVLMPVFKNEFVGAEEESDEREMLWIDTLEQLLNDDEKLAIYSKRGIQRAEDFRLDVIMEKWKNLIDSTLNDNERQS